MKRAGFSPAALAVALAWCLAAWPAGAWPGALVRVVDGDTLIVAPARTRVRLYGIDAPERGQKEGEAASEALRRLVRPGDALEVEVMGHDRYGRVVAVVWRDGRALNAELVRQGQARVWPLYCKAARCAAWSALEAGAREARIGLWAELGPLPP